MFSAIDFYEMKQIDVFFASRSILRCVCWTTKSDLSSTTKCNQNDIFDNYDFVTPKARAKHEHLFNKLTSDDEWQKP